MYRSSVVVVLRLRGMIEKRVRKGGRKERKDGGRRARFLPVGGTFPRLSPSLTISLSTVCLSFYSLARRHFRRPIPSIHSVISLRAVCTRDNFTTGRVLRVDEEPSDREEIIDLRVFRVLPSGRCFSPLEKIGERSEECFFFVDFSWGRREKETEERVLKRY